MHYTEIIAFLSLFVLMFLVILGFFGAFKCIVVLYQMASSRIWFLKRKRADIPGMILQPIESTIYQVNLDDSSLIAATQAIPLSRRRYIDRKVEEKVLEEALIQRKSVLKNMATTSATGSRTSLSSGGSGTNKIMDYDLRCLTNITEMQRLVHNCWTTNFGHRESLSEEERWIQKQVLQVNMKIENHVSGSQTDPELAVILDQMEPHFSTLLSAPTPTPPSNMSSPLHFSGGTTYYNYPPAPSYSRDSRRSSTATDAPPPKFETLLIDHPDWPPSYETATATSGGCSTSSSAIRAIKATGIAAGAGDKV